MRQDFSQIASPYDINSIVSSSKKNLSATIIKLVILFVICTLSILAVIFFRSFLSIFVIGTVIGVVSAIMFIKQLKKARLYDYKSLSGNITDVHKDVKIVSTTSVGGVGLNTRKYDTYKKNEIRLNIIIDNGEKLHTHSLIDINEEQANYYEAKGNVIHVWGTHFPVKLDIGREDWLCPFCGEFNSNKDKKCTKCDTKILL